MSDSKSAPAEIQVATSWRISSSSDGDIQRRRRPHQPHRSPDAAELNDGILEIGRRHAWVPAASHRPRADFLLRVDEKLYAALHGLVFAWHTGQTQDG